VIFEWDPKKAKSNESKHGISFPDAASVFLDSLAWTFPDPDHSVGEERFITIGRALNGELVVVAHGELEEGRIRIISARRATKRESHDYEKG
jgi:uncharacterized DUF497 family protein